MRGQTVGVADKPSGLVVVDHDKPKPGYELTRKWRQAGWHNETGIRDGPDVLAVLADHAGASWPHTFTVSTPSVGAQLTNVSPARSQLGHNLAHPLFDLSVGGCGTGRDAS